MTCIVVQIAVSTAATGFLVLMFTGAIRAMPWKRVILWRATLVFMAIFALFMVPAVIPVSIWTIVGSPPLGAAMIYFGGRWAVVDKDDDDRRRRRQKVGRPRPDLRAWHVNPAPSACTST